MKFPDSFSHTPFAEASLDLRQVQVMGVLNVTPDSFSDGGRFASRDAALRRAEAMLSAGATIIDVGGESTRPGAEPVTLSEEMGRVCPVLEALRTELGATVSVDTSSPALMVEAIRLGAGMINDVRAFRREGAVDAVVGHRHVALCVMHMQGEPDSMQKNPGYRALLSEVSDFLASRCEVMRAAGVAAHRLVIDPGFGFGKTLEHNLLLLKHFDVFLELGYPVLAGLSRKSMFGALMGHDVDQRLIASVVGAALAADRGASILRVHDVKETMDVARLVNALRNLDGG